MTQKKLDTKPIPFRGGVITGKELSLLPSGGYSAIQNMRAKHPGFEKRLGCRKLHTTADSTNEVMSLFQYSKGRVAERHFYAQMSDGDVLEAYANPPAVPELMTLDVAPATAWAVGDTITGQTSAKTCVITSILTTTTYAVKDRSGTFTLGEILTNGSVTADQGSTRPIFGDLAFGAEVHDGTSSGMVPASWSVLDDIMAYANGTDQHQLYPGTDPYVKKVIVFVSAAAIPTIPDVGTDYTEQATDGKSTTVVVLDSLGTLAQFDCVFIMTDIPATSLKFTVSAANGDSAVANIHYWNGAWTNTSMTDGTIASAGKTLGQTGSMSWTAPADEITHYLYDTCGFWYRLSLASGALDAEVEVSSIQYNTTWKALQNIWDGVPIAAGEVQVYDQSPVATYLTYGAAQVIVDDITSSDIVYFNSPDPIVGFYIDVGLLPNTTATTTINAVYYFNGSAFASVGTIYDGTDGLSKSGWVIFSRKTDDQPRQFNDVKQFSHWYYFTVDKTLSADVQFSIQVMPYFTISEFGYEGLCNVAWKDRMLYVFARYPHDIIVSAKHRPMVLNGEDYTILDRPGDGRQNRVICMKKIYNELLVWQEEKGVDGGCLTLYQGYSPGTFGKFVVSTRYGTFNAKSAVVVDGIRMKINQVEDPPVSAAFFLSHYGVFMCDGKTVECISDQPHSSIQNYFDPTQSVCIRTGYEMKMWLAYDPAFHCLRIGLVSGSSATLPNVFPVYDLQDRTWSFDNLSQEFSFLTTVEAASGNVTSIQVAGGIDDGQVYQSNYAGDDLATAIDAYATMEIDVGGAMFNLDEIILRMKSQSAGNCTVTPSLNGIAGTAKTLSMVAAVANQVGRRHRTGMNLTSEHISLKFQNATASQSVLLKDLTVFAKVLEGQ